MAETHHDFSRSQLRMLFRLIPEAERGTALNLRSHNPVDVEMVTEVQLYVDRALEIRNGAFFRSGDGLHSAAVKGIRNMLASRVKRKWISRWFLSAGDAHSRDCLAGYLDGLYDSARVRWLRVAGLPKVVVLGLLLLGKRTKRLAEGPRRAVRAARDLCAGGMPETVENERRRSESEAGESRSTVVVLTSLLHPIVNFTVKRVVEELNRRDRRVVLAFHDGFMPEKAVARENLRWCARIGSMSLERTDGALSCVRTLFRAPHLMVSIAGSVATALRAAVKAPASDWRIRWCLLRNVPALVAGFHVSLWHVQKLLARFKPASVLNCDNGSENLYVKAFAYHCLRNGVPFYRYKPVPFFPVRQPAFNSVSRFMLVTPDDAAVFRNNGSVPECWDVGSPILDLAAPFTIRNASNAARAADRAETRIIFFTKRDFPNRSVITAICQHCAHHGRRAKLTVKFHPSDADEFGAGRLESAGPVRIVYYGREEIEHVDRLIFESDIVVTGSSNVIWSAFAQFKPVVYLGLKGMSSDLHREGYRRYATSDFVAASEIAEIGDVIGRLIGRTTNGGFLKHFERHESLMRNFFCSGEFNSTERICRILVNGA